MDESIRQKLKPGVRVRVTQQIAARNYALPSTVSGMIVDYAQKETGSWFAHAKDDRLWLDRLVIRKEDVLDTVNFRENQHSRCSG